MTGGTGHLYPSLPSAHVAVRGLLSRSLASREVAKPFRPIGRVVRNPPSDPRNGAFQHSGRVVTERCTEGQVTGRVTDRAVNPTVSGLGFGLGHVEGQTDHTNSSRSKHKDECAIYCATEFDHKIDHIINCFSAPQFDGVCFIRHIRHIRHIQCLSGVLHPDVIAHGGSFFWLRSWRRRHLEAPPAACSQR